MNSCSQTAALLRRSAALGIALAGTGTAAGDEEFHTLKVGIVVYEGVEMLDFAGPTEVFDAAGKELRVDGRPLFEVVTVAPTKGAVVTSGGVTLEPRFAIAQRPQVDIVVIPGGETGALDDPAFLDWLRATAPQATVVLSVCNGAFVLAHAGLLEGGEATTFHSFLGFLKEAAPKAKVLSGRRIVDNGRIMTAGGVACGIDGALHVVAKLGGRRMADAVAAYMEYRWIPEPQLEGTYSDWTTVGGARAELLQQLRWYRRKSDWKKLEEVARELTDLDPDDGSAWYELGSALYAEGRLAETIEASEESASHPGRRPHALYLLSCAWARQGEKEKALAALARAADAGWFDRTTTEKDADLASLRGDARFMALLERIGAQGTDGRPEWVAAMLTRAGECHAAGEADGELQFLANCLNGAPGSEPARAALEKALASSAASEAFLRNARHVLAAHPQPPRAPDRPHRVALVLFDGIPLVELIASARILDTVPGFTTYTVAASRTPVATDAATIVPDYTFADAPPPDVILVTSGSGGLRDAALMEWLRKYGPQAQTVMSVCNGALVLANAGLLDGRAATCPGGNLDGLLLLGHDVHPYRGRRFVRDGNVVTCDSYFAGVDGALEVVSTLCGEAAASSSARRNLYAWRPQELDASHPAGEETGPSHHLQILRTLLERGAAAATAEYREWKPERFPFHILAWTLGEAGRTDDAVKLCEWTAATFPDSALALACLGEALFESGRFEEALPVLIEADQKEPGEARAQEFLAALLHHADHVANEESRNARRILREHAADAAVTLVPSGEPGERMVIRGTVRDAAGQPIAGALVAVHQADASGRYTPTAATDEENARLFAFLRTDKAGRYEFTTVRPGGVTQRVHVEVEAPGHAPRRLQLLFRDDPQRTAQTFASAQDEGNPVIALERDGAGVLQGRCDLALP